MTIISIGNGTLLVKGDADIHLEAGSGEIMRLKTQNGAGGFGYGGLSILGNGANESYYFSDDENYISIGRSMNSISPSYTSFEIQQKSSVTKAITINGANASNQWWDFAIISYGNLALYFNN